MSVAGVAAVTVVDPETLVDEKHSVFELTDTGSSWVRVSLIPSELSRYGSAQFDQLFALHPDHRHSVIMSGEREIPVHRWQQSYLNTPAYDPTDPYFGCRSYMYAGLSAQQQTGARAELPASLRPFYEYVKTVDPRYNQMVVNWYEDDDFIAFHHDCLRKVVRDVPIVVISLSPPGAAAAASPAREFSLKYHPKYPAAEEATTTTTPKHSVLNIRLVHGCMVEMGGKAQCEFSHGVPRLANGGKRISLSFRACEEE